MRKSLRTTAVNVKSVFSSFPGTKSLIAKITVFASLVFPNTPYKANLFYLLPFALAHGCKSLTKKKRNEFFSKFTCI